MKGIRKNLLGVVMAIVMVIGGLVVLPEKVNAAVTDTVLRWPTDSTKVTQNFSATSKYVHQGIDISGSLNANIYAAEAGTVVSRGNISGGYGNYLVIQHQSGLFTLYGHLNKYASNVEVNQKVAKGQVVAYMGNTGNSSGVHLHFEVRKVKTLYYDSQLSSIQKNLYNPASFKYIYNNSGASTIANSKITQIPSTISQGDAWTCDGTISSNYNLKYANGYIIKNTGKASMWNDEEKVYAIKGSDLKENTTKTYNLKNSAIDRGLLFNKLSPGNYYYVITARDMTDAPLQVIYKFSIVAKVSNNKPQGNVDSVVCDTSGKIHVQGWAYDPDSKSTALDIHVYVGGSASPSVPCTPIKANLERKDVNKVYGCGDYHGFNAQISTSRTGNVDVYIYAIDTAGGENPLLGKRTVNVTAHTHNYNIAGNVTKQATCTENGTQVYKCSCGATTNKTIEKIGHTIVVDEAVSPTYTSDGLTEGSHCSKCNKVIVPQKVIPVLEYVQEYSKDDDVNYPDEKTKDDIINSPEDSKYDYTQDNNMSGNDQVKYEDKETLIKEEQGKNEQIQKDASINTPQKNVSEKENSSGSSNVSKNNNKKNTITKINVNNVHENAVEEDVFTIKNATYEIMSDNTVMFAYVNTNTVKSYTVPATVTYNGKKYKVTCIFDEAFMDCSTLKKITIGKNVDEIGDDVFKNCNNLKNIIIKSTKLTKNSIGKNAFKGISKKATFRCPKKQLKNYKKWIKKAGAPKTAKYKKQ